MRKLLSVALILAMLLSISIPGLGAPVYAADGLGDGVLITSADDVTVAELGEPDI
jgi:hypothetical protein